MNITYFLTGSYNDVDNDFELTINTITSVDQSESKDSCEVVLRDISSENKLMWQTTQPTFVLCLNDLDEFIIENTILFYSKILTSSHRDNVIDKELEGFILNRLEY
ncbi:hypothetical protein B0A79_15670 [Flavobacterium piscis]|uniref:Uncharacterized protein n=1 Tax=Flavobacterium piscis TaxID=1114874 RepID=A0ABX2XPP9_9FLAO|nr:hypothetical protein [Flavobacterium piscis]OCB78245.1 hypothetical protein FLP_00625 [Flavobacterium piscis]OXG02387.1 hypothetical protein B0A79_15670 [Flavobacterium piscis]